MLRSTCVLLTRLITGANAVWVNCAPDSRNLRIYFANHGSGGIIQFVAHRTRGHHAA
jgi:hypothetical protein